MLVKFYTSAASKQNMWVELEGSEGMRYEINVISGSIQACLVETGHKP